jgi:hypothetical protein
MSKPRLNVFEILLDLKNGKSKNSVAKKYNTSINGINYIINNKKKFIKDKLFYSIKFNLEQLQFVENIILPFLFKAFVIDGKITDDCIKKTSNILYASDLYSKYEIEYLLEKYCLKNTILNQYNITINYLIKKIYN